MKVSAVLFMYTRIDLIYQYHVRPTYRQSISKP